MTACTWNWSEQKEYERTEKGQCEAVIQIWFRVYLLQLLHAHGVDRYLTSGTFFPLHGLLLQKITSELLHCDADELLSHSCFLGDCLKLWGVVGGKKDGLWTNDSAKCLTTGGAMTHQGSSDAVLFTNVTEVSRATGLEPDVVSKLGVVLQRKQTAQQNITKFLQRFNLPSRFLSQIRI